MIGNFPLKTFKLCVWKQKCVKQRQLCSLFDGRQHTGRHIMNQGPHTSRPVRLKSAVVFLWKRILGCSDPQAGVWCNSPNVIEGLNCFREIGHAGKRITSGKQRMKTRLRRLFTCKVKQSTEIQRHMPLSHVSSSTSAYFSHKIPHVT
jgi:hypothetical protein